MTDNSLLALKRLLSIKKVFGIEGKKSHLKDPFGDPF